MGLTNDILDLFEILYTVMNFIAVLMLTRNGSVLKKMTSIDNFNSLRNYKISQGIST